MLDKEPTKASIDIFKSSVSSTRKVILDRLRASSNINESISVILFGKITFDKLICLKAAYLIVVSL